MTTILKEPATTGFTSTNSVADLIIKFVGTSLSKSIDVPTINAGLDLLANANATATPSVYVNALNALLTKATTTTYNEYSASLTKALNFLNNITIY